VSYRTIATNIVSQVCERKPAVPVLNSITHNHYAYRDTADPVCRRLCVMLDELMSACHKAGLHVIPATLQDVTDEVLARPAVAEPFVCEGAIFDLTSDQAEIDATAR
jgi:hypothetical protein